MKVALSVVIGIVLGIGAILPGVSGGVLAVALGYYEKILSAASGFFRAPKKNFLFLLPIGIGGAAGVYGVSVLLSGLLSQYESEVQFLFVGLVIGSFPSVFRQSGLLEKFRKRYILLFIAAAALVITLSFFIPESSGTDTGSGFLPQFAAGIIIAMGIVFPGISASVVLMLLGVYNELMAAISGLKILDLIPAGLGLGLGVLAFLRLADLLIHKYRRASYSAVVGFMTGSVAAMLKETPAEPLWACLLMLAVGAAAAIAFGRIESRVEA